MRPVISSLVGLIFFISAAEMVSAADLPTKRMVTKAPPLPPAVSWTGCYLGGNGGYAKTHKDWVFSDGVPQGSHDPKGGVGGVQIGCDWQANPRFVLGVRGMYDWANLSGTNIEAEFTGHTVNTRVRGFGTAVARAGVLANPNLLFYVLGGFAWVRDNHWEANRTTGAVEATNSNTRVGYDVGVGAEFLFTPNWSFFVEYDYMNFGTRRLTFACPPCVGGTEQYDIKQNLSKVLVGVNWRFGPSGPGRW